MKRSFILPLIIIMYPFSFLLCQSMTMEGMINGVETQIANFPLEKVYLHTDRPYYVAGDDIWYAAYGVDGSDHKEDPVSGLVYIELINPQGKVILNKHVQLDGKVGDGVIELEEDLESGVYQLRAYSAYMLNYEYKYAFTKEIAIYNKSQDDNEIAIKDKDTGFPIRFFPEGGELVADIDCKVAFEIENKDVKSIEVLDSKDQVVSVGKVIHEGIGFFSLKPNFEEKYRVVFDGKDFKLPYVNPKGFGIKVNNLGKNSLYIDLLSSNDLGLEGGFIIGHMRGLVFLAEDYLGGNKATIKIDKSKLPEGVAQFTIFDSKGRAVTERTVFIDHEKNRIDVSATIPYDYINTRQKVDLSISLSDSESIPIDGQLSVSIVDAGLVFGQKDAINIQSYLLLGSDFTESIPNINSYFVEDDNKTRYYLDLLMMTRGWTRIRWQDVSKNVFPELIYPPENGFTISGLVTHKGDPVQGIVDISIVKDIFSGDAIKTDENGRFFANLLSIQDSSQIYIKASLLDETKPNMAGSNEGVVVTLYNNNKFSVESSNVIKYIKPENDFLSSYLEQTAKKRTIDSIYDTDWTIELDEVSIKASDLSADVQIKREYSLPYSNYSNRIIFDSLKTGVFDQSIFDIVRNNIPGVEVLGLPGQTQRFRVRGGSSSIIGSNDALVLVDGVETSVETLNAIRSDRIAFIDVMKGAASSVIYGSNNGVVLIYTKQLSDEQLTRDYSRPDHTKKIEYLGYKSNREFYSPNYSKSFAGAEKPDLRITLYWNPKITTSGGTSISSFYSSDKITRYTIEVQGITKSGIPFVGYDTLDVR